MIFDHLKGKMKRIVDSCLQDWKYNPHRMPLLIRGARGVGKTYAIRELGKTFKHFIEVNFEFEGASIKGIFEKDLDPDRILRALAIRYKTEIIPNETLLFFDEIQEIPEAIIALRYFYEKMPTLHVIAAGSLLDFAIEKVGVPVGRIEFLYMYPLSFMEFLVADGFSLAMKEILLHDPRQPMSELIHTMLLDKLGEYLAIGGMPKVIEFWLNKKPQQCFKIQSAILDSYKQDFGDYAKKHQFKYLEEIFNNAPLQLGARFKYSKVGEYRKRDLEPCIDLLEKARVINKVLYTAGQGIPLGAQTNIDDFKLLFLDVGLTQSVLGLDVSQWLISPKTEFINKGPLIEAFVGQEILAYSNPIRKSQLYYWHRETRGSEAELDYLLQLKNHIIPIEVKSGQGRTLRSMQLFLETHKNSPYGIRFSTNNYSIYEKIHSYPLYAIIKIMVDQDSHIKNSIFKLIT